jgi:hypothetical protein
MPFEITKTILSFFGIRLVLTEDPEARPPSYDTGRPQPPHHLEPNGLPRIYKKRSV